MAVSDHRSPVRFQVEGLTVPEVKLQASSSAQLFFETETLLTTLVMYERVIHTKTQGASWVFISLPEVQPRTPKLSSPFLLAFLPLSFVLLKMSAFP